MTKMTDENETVDPAVTAYWQKWGKPLEAFGITGTESMQTFLRRNPYQDGNLMRRLELSGHLKEWHKVTGDHFPEMLLDAWQRFANAYYDYLCNTVEKLTRSLQPCVECYFDSDEGLVSKTAHQFAAARDKSADFAFRMVECYCEGKGIDSAELARRLESGLLKRSMVIAALGETVTPDDRYTLAEIISGDLLHCMDPLSPEAPGITPEPAVEAASAQRDLAEICSDEAVRADLQTHGRTGGLATRTDTWLESNWSRLVESGLSGREIARRLKANWGIYLSHSAVSRLRPRIFGPVPGKSL